MRKTKTTTASLAALVAVATLAAPADRRAQAQEALALQPYIGCWEALDVVPGEGVLCFVPTDGQVEMLTVVDGAVEYREPFSVDGRERSVEQDECRGTETARASSDGQRIYTASAVTCQGGSLRRSTGIISMPAPDEWVDVRAMEANGGTTAWSRWYQRADDDVLAELGIRTGARPFAGGAAAARATAPIDVADVIDAARNVDGKAVEAWVAELGQEFRGLDADDLIRMADAGVPEDVVDVVVAVSFPERFALNRGRPAPDEYAGARRAGRPIWLDPTGYYDPYYGYGYGYSRYSRFGYGGYGYGGWRNWGYGYGYTPVVVNVDRKLPAAGGRVVAGKGYRRGGAAAVAPSSQPFGSGSGRSTIGSSGGSRTSPPPARSGSTGRKAKRRGK